MSIAKNSRNFYVKPESAERKIYLTLKKSLQQPLNLFQPDDIDFYKRRCSELEAQVKMLEKSQDYVAACQGSELESYYNENQLLAMDKDNLMRKLNQKQTESDLWKQKYENQINQMLQIKSNYESEIKLLQSEINTLVDRVEKFSNHQNDEKQKTLEVSQSNEKKLRDLVEKKNQEIINLEYRLKKIADDDEREIKRLLMDNQNLRSILSQTDNRESDFKELQSQWESLRRSLVNQISSLEQEIEQLHIILNQKSYELDQATKELVQQRGNYEQEIMHLNKQISSTERSFYELKVGARDDLENLEIHLKEVHQKEMNRILMKFETQAREIEKENSNLRDIIEKQQKQIYDCEMIRKEAEQKKLKYMEIENENSRLKIEKDETIRLMDIEFRNHHMDDQKQIECLKRELLKLEDEINQKNNEVSDQQQGRFQLEVLILENMLFQQDIINELKMENEQLKLRIYEIEIFKDKTLEEFKFENQLLDSKKNEKVGESYWIYYQIQLLQSQIENYQIELKRLKELLDKKAEEIDVLLVKQNILERENCKLRDSVNELQTELVSQERIYIQKMNDLRNSMDSFNVSQQDSTQRHLSVQIQNLSKENKDLRSQLDRKTREIYDR